MLSDKEHFNNFGRKYGTFQAYPLSEYRKILSLSGVTHEPKNKRVLDIGCGGGIFSLCLKDLGFKVAGIDISEKLISIASDKIQGRTDIYFCVGDIRHMPFKDNSFDIIFSGAAIHHLPNQIYQCASEFYRILPADGKVYLFEPYALCINSLLYYWVFCFGRAKDEKALNPSLIKNEFKKAGFSDFQWTKTKGVRHVYYFPKNFILKKWVGILRKIINEFILPNVFFVCSFKKN